MATTYLTRTFSSSGTSDKIWTWSSWIKRSEVTGEAAILTAGSSARDFIRFEASTTIGALRVRFSNGSADVTTNRRFRDTSGWYHLVVAVDTTQATASNRIKIYINGVQETSFSSSSYPSQNYVTKIGGAHVHNIGNDSEQTVPYFDGSMSHINFIDGTAYDASAFGEYDANGVWTINTSPSVTYGTNGFFILKDSGSVTDQSGNGNNFTVGGGTLTDTLDCSANVFNVWNALVSYPTYPNSLSNGNTTITANANATQGSTSPGTIGVSSGKYYFEFKVTTSTMNNSSIGMCKADMNFNYQADAYPYNASLGNNGIHYVGDGTIYVNGSSAGNQGAWSQNDIIGLAVDLDNGNIAFTKNGSAVYTSSNGSLISGQEYTPAFYGYGSLSGSANFGNGYFGTTAVSSAGTNASGNGIFEYDVPTGYTALCTKGLNGE